MSTSTQMPLTVLITGANGFLGRAVLRALRQHPQRIANLLALDIRQPASDHRQPGVEYLTLDIRSPDMADLLQQHVVDVVVHLATIMPGRRKNERELAYSVDVLGTRHLLDACVVSGVRQFIYTSSGAAYGYHADNPPWLSESDPLRGNADFAYAHHKRLVEDMLADYRRSYPQLKQLIFRPGTILGREVNSPISQFFEKSILLGLTGSQSPFVFIWDEDVAQCIVKGILEGKSGIYNLAGDGALPLPQLAKLMGKPYLALPAGLVRAALWLLRRLRLTQYGPEQVDFIRYRPVLSNQRLKEEFGYTPRFTSEAAFLEFLRQRGLMRKEGH
ncbi:MAG: SDR family oxidoreductase [candidate division KSB1 bacterium]|nr:SDR family oxidoreductase [candidate division KSB1 bacterium]